MFVPSSSKENITAQLQLHSTNLELRFCAGSNPARSESRFPMVKAFDSRRGLTFFVDKPF